MKRRDLRKLCKTIRTIATSIPKLLKSYLDETDEGPKRICLRIYFQNMNMLKLREGENESKIVFRLLLASGVLVVCLSELNKNMENVIVQRNLEKVMNKTM